MNWTWLIIAVPLWILQYVIYVPIVLLWRVFVAIVRFALTIGLWGILLLFLPIIGWVILLLWLLLRRDDRRYKDLVEAIGKKEGIETRRRSIWRPWFIDRIRSEPAAG